MGEIEKTMNVSRAYLLNKWAGFSAYDDVAALIRVVEALETRLPAASTEAETAERGRRLAREQIESMLAECRRRAVLDPEDVIEGLDRLRRILGIGPGGRS